VNEGGGDGSCAGWHDKEARRASNHLLVDDVRQTFEDEAPIVVAESELDFEPARRARCVPRGTSSERERARDGTADGNDLDADDGGADERSPRPEPEVRHRFDRRRRRGHTEAARRLIVLRDRRRGRPGKTRPPKHGSDPPTE
jgi:hypothetical protein